MLAAPITIAMMDMILLVQSGFIFSLLPAFRGIKNPPLLSHWRFVVSFVFSLLLYFKSSWQARHSPVSLRGLPLVYTVGVWSPRNLPPQELPWYNLIIALLHFFVKYFHCFSCAFSRIRFSTSCGSRKLYFSM